MFRHLAHSGIILQIEGCIKPQTVVNHGQKYYTLTKKQVAQILRCIQQSQMLSMHLCGSLEEKRMHLVLVVRAVVCLNLWMEEKLGINFLKDYLLVNLVEL